MIARLKINTTSKDRVEKGLLFIIRIPEVKISIGRGISLNHDLLCFLYSLKLNLGNLRVKLFDRDVVMTECHVSKI